MQGNTLQEGSDQWKAVEFYKQGVDMDTRNAPGIAPLQPQLDAIASITSLDAMHPQMASSDFAGIPDFFNVGPGPIPPIARSPPPGWPARRSVCPM